MTDFSEFFLSTTSDVVMLETIELSHSDISQIYRIVRNKTSGLTATLESGATVSFDYYPMSINRGDDRQNIDQSLEIMLGDLGEVLPLEIDLINNAGSYSEKPSLIYRLFRSDILTSPMEVISLDVQNISFSKEGAMIKAQTKSLNSNGTGERYTFDRFPMLLGVL